jgi:hypothetical protein
LDLQRFQYLLEDGDHFSNGVSAIKHKSAEPAVGEKL